MTKKKYQRYSSEFKSLALSRASEDGVTVRGFDITSHDVE